MHYHQLLGTVESHLTRREIENRAIDTGNLLALAALQCIGTEVTAEWERGAEIVESVTNLVDYNEQTLRDRQRLDAAYAYTTTQPE
jgi:hypothetical protein